MDDDAWAAGVRVALGMWRVNGGNVALLTEELAAAGAKMVPTEATEDMCDAYWRAAGTDYPDPPSPGDAYAAMVAASPPLARGT